MYTDIFGQYPEGKAELKHSVLITAVTVTPVNEKIR